jgi:hypothetical protein
MQALRACLTALASAVSKRQAQLLELATAVSLFCVQWLPQHNKHVVPFNSFLSLGNLNLQGAVYGV